MKDISTVPPLGGKADSAGRQRDSVTSLRRERDEARAKLEELRQMCREIFGESTIAELRRSL